MGSPENSKTKILDSATELFAARGYLATSINDIIKAAIVTKSNFYYHFKSKEELALSVLNSLEAKFYTEILHHSLLNKSIPAKERFEKFFNCLISLMEHSCCTIGCPFTNIATETSDFYPSFRERVVHYFENLIQITAECYEDGVKEGAFNPFLNSKEIAQFIVSAIKGTMIQSKVYKSTQPIVDNTKIIFQLITKS